MKIPAMGTLLFKAVERTDGRTDRQADREADRHDKPNIRFSQCCEKQLKLNTTNINPRIRVIRRCRYSSCRSS
jgi:hypothetical protein